MMILYGVKHAYLSEQSISHLSTYQAPPVLYPNSQSKVLSNAFLQGSTEISYSGFQTEMIQTG